MSHEKDYVLGTHDAEIERLGLQHRVWRPRAADAWRRAGFGSGQTLLDVGCGPGWASLDLAEIAGPAGRVIAIDRSRRFLGALETAARSRGLAQLATLELDLDESPLPEFGADGAWSRWVYAFVRDPKRLLARVAAALRPGGTMVLHEYVDYRGWRLSTRPPEFEAFVSQVMASWREGGGEPDIGIALPGWLAELGFEIRTLAPLVDTVRPGDFVAEWPRAFVNVGLERLVDLGRVTSEQAAEVRRAWAEWERTPGAFQVTPPVIEIIAVKSGGA
jgi:SAM-dependent methyltransferase